MQVLHCLHQALNRVVLTRQLILKYSRRKLNKMHTFFMLRIEMILSNAAIACKCQVASKQVQVQVKRLAL